MYHRALPALTVLAASAALAPLILAGTGSAAARLAPAAVTATTVLSNRPDGGTHDNPVPGTNQTWANDHFTRVVSIQRVSQVSVSNCPGSDTGRCYLWIGEISDSGHFTTNPTSTSGSGSPQAGKTLDTAVTGIFAGGSKTIEFFSSRKTASASRVPATENDHGVLPAGRHTTTKWVELFFVHGAVFNSAANPGGPDLGHWSWTYTAGFGSNSACPNDAYRWVDAANNGGGARNTDGDVLAPDSADCT
jgi:hypothetical protein